jgi:death on curing protein
MKMELIFLTLDEVIRIHKSQIDNFGGTNGIRDLNLLESAISQPCAQFGGSYLHGDIYEMAAAYLFHIVRNHPFLDGNKRTGIAAALIFMEINGVNFDYDEDELGDLVINVVECKADKPEIAAFFRKGMG